MTSRTQANDLASLLQSDELPSVNTEAGCETYSDWLSTSPNERARTCQPIDKISSYQNQLINTHEITYIDKPLEHTSVLNPALSRHTAIRGNEISQVYQRDGNNFPYQSQFSKINVIPNTDNPDRTAHIPNFSICSHCSIKPNDSSLIYSQSKDRYHCQPYVVNINGLDYDNRVQTTNVHNTSVHPQFPSNQSLYDSTATPKIHSSLPYITTGELTTANCSSNINSKFLDYTSDNSPHSTNYLRKRNEHQMGKTLPRQQQLQGYSNACNRPDYTSGFSEDVVYTDSTNMLDKWNTGVVNYLPTSTLQHIPEQSIDFCRQQSHADHYNKMPCLDDTNIVVRNKNIPNYPTKPVTPNPQLINVGTMHDAGYSIRAGHITSTHPSQQNVARWIYKHRDHMNPTVIIPDDRSQRANPEVITPICRSPQIAARTPNIAQYQPLNTSPPELTVRYHRPQTLIYPDLSHRETGYINPNMKNLIPGQLEFPYHRAGSQAVPDCDGHSPNKIRKFDTDPSISIVYKDVIISPEQQKPSAVDKGIHETSFGSLYSLIESISWDNITFSEKFDVDKYLDSIESKSDQVLPVMQKQSCPLETKFTTSGELLLKRNTEEPKVSETMVPPVMHRPQHRPAVVIVSNPDDQNITWTSGMPPDQTARVTAESCISRQTGQQHELYQNLIQDRDITKSTSGHVSSNIQPTGTSYQHHLSQNVRMSEAGCIEPDADYRTDNTLASRTQVHILPQEDIVVPSVKMRGASTPHTMSRDDHSVAPDNVCTTEVKHPKTKILPKVIIKEQLDSEHTTTPRKENIISTTNLRGNIEYLLSIPEVHSTSNKPINVQASVIAHTSLPNLSQSVGMPPDTYSSYTCAGNIVPQHSQLHTTDPNIQGPTNIGNTPYTTPHTDVPDIADTFVPKTTGGKMDRFDMERLWKQQLASRRKK